ncbi:MAG: hypothetical protein K8R58_02425 [Bacteroidales bacterium]|nr:hypothetical protein [Bacteroidales bacterium]
MKIKKRFWVVLVYLGIVLLFYLAINPISNLIAKMQYGDSEFLFQSFYYPLASIGYIVYIVYGFAIITAGLSFFFYSKYRRQNKMELMKGFKITSIISVIGLVYLITGLIFS